LFLNPIGLFTSVTLTVSPLVSVRWFAISVALCFRLSPSALSLIAES
jgi:hypothetical protein